MTSTLATSTFPTRKIGDDQVTSVGAGLMGIGNYAYGHGGSVEERLKFFDRLYELGCTNWDSANVYGDSEEVIGRWFSRTGKRNEIFLATKFGIKSGPGGKRIVDGKPEYARSCLESSLKKLGIDHIDLYYLHRPDPNTPIEVTVREMKKFVEEGKVRYIGLSEISPDSLRRAHKVHPIAAIQVEYSPFVLDIERPGNLLDTARELGIAIVAYSPLGRGFVTGQIKSLADLGEGDFRRTIPKYSEQNFPRILELADALSEIGKKHGATAGQVSLAWLLAQGDDIIPIPGTKKVKYLEENVGAVNVKLSKDDLDAIRKAAKSIDDLGAQYGPGMMETVQAETPPLRE